MDRETLRGEWKRLARKKENTAALHFQFCLMRAAIAHSNTKYGLAVDLAYNAFTSVTNATKLANGRQPYDAIRDAIAWVVAHGKNSPLYGLMDDETEATYLALLSHVLMSRMRDKTYLYMFTQTHCSAEKVAINTAALTFKAARELTRPTKTVTRKDGKVTVRWSRPAIPTDLEFVVFGIADRDTMMARMMDFPQQRVLCAISEPDHQSFCLKPMRGSMARRKKYFIGDQLMRIPLASLVRMQESLSADIVVSRMLEVPPGIEPETSNSTTEMENES